MRNFYRLLVVSLAAVALVSGPVRAQTAASVWHFNESSGSTAFDAVGSVNGLLQGDASFAPGGISGNAIAMTFAGNGFVDMGNNYSLSGSSTFSIVAWVKLNSGDTTGYHVAGRHQRTVVSGYFLGINDVMSTSGEVAGGALFYQAYPNPVSPNLSLNDGNWHQLVGVQDLATNQSKLYVDSVLQPTQPYTAFANSIANFTVGGILNPSGTAMGSSFTGMADEVSIWNQALNPDEVAYLFNNPGAVAVPEPTTMAFILMSTMLAGGYWWKKRRQMLAYESSILMDRK